MFSSRFHLETGAEATTLGMRVWRVKTSFQRLKCGFSRGRRVGPASIAYVFDPIEAAEGRSVIFSLRACRTASGRAFFMMWVAVDKWIRCGLRMGLDKRNEDSLSVRLLHV
ncbi:MAG: hypothetical protein DMG85_17180 [Acidobacteria bacterium]|nr:MAG: hypothetical protein DMG85_17180 [Acidobacteriota bacterium]